MHPSAATLLVPAPDQHLAIGLLLVSFGKLHLLEGDFPVSADPGAPMAYAPVDNTHVLTPHTASRTWHLLIAPTALT